MAGGPGTQRSVTLRFLAAPMDANASGRVGGGKMLEWIDKAGYAAAVGWAGTYCVTLYVGNIHFTRPVQVGHLVEVEARVVYTGRTSLQVVCTVSSGDPRQGDLRVNTVCLLAFVAMGDDGKPTPVPTFVPEDAWEVAQNTRAKALNVVRKEIEAELARQRYSEHTASCRETLRFLAAPTDVNWGGKVHGGYVMHWISSTAKLVAERWHQGEARATFAGGVRFYRPMFIGDLVEVEARLILTRARSCTSRCMCAPATRAAPSRCPRRPTARWSTRPWTPAAPPRTCGPGGPACPRTSGSRTMRAPSSRSAASCCAPTRPERPRAAQEVCRTRTPAPVSWAFTVLRLPGSTAAVRSTSTVVSKPDRAASIAVARTQ